MGSKNKWKIHERFIKKTATAGSATVLAPTIISSSVFGANDRINAAVLGVNGRGKPYQWFENQKNVQVTTLCDPDLNILNERQKNLKTANKSVALEQDLRRVMDDKDIDVVSIVTPTTGMHYPSFGPAKQERMSMLKNLAPIIYSKEEKMVEATQKYDRIVQHGVQLRSSPMINEAIELMRDGSYQVFIWLVDLFFVGELILVTKDFLQFQKA